jgi:hypothetical protein
VFALAHAFVLSRALYLGLSSRLFQGLVQHYHAEGWWPLLNDVLESALVCEQNLSNAEGYYTYALQLLPSGTRSLQRLPLLPIRNAVGTPSAHAQQRLYAEMTGTPKRKQQIQADITAAITVRART